MEANSRILVIEDEEKLRGNIETLLSGEHYEVSGAGNGKEGLEKLNHQTYDLVITDLMMPQVEGLEVMRFIQENFPQVTMIVITGYSSMDSAVEAMRRGAYDYIASFRGETIA